MIYSVWKARNSYPLYEAPALVFSSSLYNFMFYETSAWAAEALHLDGDDLLLSARLTTFSLALIGVIVGLATAAGMGFFSERSYGILAGSAIAMFWLGTVPVGWWAWSVRPDVGAVCLASLGLLCYLRFLETGSTWTLLLASLGFLSAWSFKQSIVSTFVGTVLVTLACRRRWKFLLALIGPFAVGVAASLYIGGPDYRFNILRVPSLGLLDLPNAAKAIAKPMLENPLLYLSPILALGVLVLAKTTPEQSGKQPAAWGARLKVLGSIYLCTLAGAALLCLRSESDINYLFEAGMVASIAALPSAIVLFQWSKQASGWFYSLAGAILAGICILQLAICFAPSVHSRIPNSLAFLRTSEFGRLNLLTPPQEQNRRALAGLIAAAPKPVLIIDDIFSQPWHSTNNSYPAFSVDPTILYNLRLRGVIKDDRVATLVKSRRFGTVVLSEPDYISLARQCGYDSVADLAGGAKLLRRSGPQQ